ncbi:MAG: hypothetical protein KatS3mg050_0673 [Litorilinea sp.]|nr:MAG: hypothetical protein KatS3mg050_0673 [Litorilinea sp.]
MHTMRIDATCGSVFRAWRIRPLLLWATLLTLAWSLLGCAPGLSAPAVLNQAETIAREDARRPLPQHDSSAPIVTVEVRAATPIYPGDPVTIVVRAISQEPVDAYRLAIDDADTGWRAVKRLPGGLLSFEWTAGEPGSYVLIGQARTTAGAVGEGRRLLTVEPPDPSSSQSGQPGSRPDPTAQDTVIFYASSVTLPTYPFAEYQSQAVDPAYRWPYRRFDRDRFWQQAPQPSPQTYQLLILENRYLQVLILPELGGRIWQVIHKPSGNRMFYQNNVVKPSPWGPPQQLGWLALGGLEWNLPVIEHGYDWGTPWDYRALQESDTVASVTVATPRDGRLLHASITVTLRAGSASLEVAPTITNLSPDELQFDYWQTAMLAPGTGNRPSPDLHFVLPGQLMTVHSTANPDLTGPTLLFTWPHYKGRDLSRLGNWREYLGFFEYPAAHGPFTAVYDPWYDAGAVRIYPPEIMRGSKVFGLGWENALGSDLFTDDDSAYVELHGGLAPSFFEQARLAGGASISWQEQWYPVVDLGDLTTANANLALHLARTADAFRVGLYPTRPLNGVISLLADGVPVARRTVVASPEAPFQGVLPVDGAILPQVQQWQLQVEDQQGQRWISYEMSDPS